MSFESYVLVWHTRYAKPVLQRFCSCDTLTQERKSHHAQITHLQFQIRIKQHTPGLKLSTLSFKDLLLKTHFFLTYRIGSKCLFVAFTVLRSLVPITGPKLYFLLLCSFCISMRSGLHTGQRNGSGVWVPRFNIYIISLISHAHNLGKDSQALQVSARTSVDG